MPELPDEVWHSKLVFDKSIRTGGHQSNFESETKLAGDHNDIYVYPGRVYCSQQFWFFRRLIKCNHPMLPCKCQT